jgi:hypothetical protein
MNSTKHIVRDYLQSLKEDKELDSLFPILLNLMGFRIIQTAKESKGQSQYGKDIIAIGKDENGKKFRWYFELKGFKDKDIDISNFTNDDGIKQSIIESKYAAFNDKSIPEFDLLPFKVVVVHNGILKTNFRPTFDGFIRKEFQDSAKDGEFERWDIFLLTDLFSEYMFDEYLLSDKDSNRLLKRTLAYLDSPENNFSDFKELVDIQLSKVFDTKSRGFKKLFATLRLLNTLIYHYSIENNYLIPSKECSKYLVLKTWRWILLNKLEGKNPVINEFKKILNEHYIILNTYLKKTFSIATLPNGLFAENGAIFEKIGYPLRSYEYIDDVIHYFRVRQELFKHTEIGFIKLKNRQKDYLINLIQNNSSFSRPILDNHSIVLSQIFIFFADKTSLRQEDVNFLYSFVMSIIENFSMELQMGLPKPDINNNIELLIEYIVTGEKPEGYQDSTSILFGLLLEFSVLFNSLDLFSSILELLNEDISIQIPLIDFEKFSDVETLLFEKNLHSEYYVDIVPTRKILLISNREEAFKEFKKWISHEQIQQIEFTSDKKGLSCLRYLAHSYFKNELLPFEWRNTNT